MSEEAGCEIGEEIGYEIRFEHVCGSNTGLKFMTDGCLLRECLTDPWLKQYDVVMLDEAHERSIQVCGVLARRPW